MLDGGEKASMFILLKSGAMLNLFWLQDCFQGKHEKNIVIFYMINGSKVIEEYDTEQEAKKRVDDVHFAMDEAGVGDNKPLIVEELPTENISTRRSYLIKVSDDPEDGYQEWKYIEQPDGTYKWEMLGIQKDYSYSKEDIDDMKSEIDGRLDGHDTDITNLQNNKQDNITQDNKLLSDLVDDTNQNHKFVSEADKTNWNNKTTRELHGTNGKALMFNEEDGSGAKFEHTDGTWSFVGVNDGGENGITGQIYTVKKVNNKYVGTRINMTKDKFYYLPNKDNSNYTANDEIATKGDVLAAENLLEWNEY